MSSSSSPLAPLTERVLSIVATNPAEESRPKKMVIQVVKLTGAHKKNMNTVKVIFSDGTSQTEGLLKCPAPPKEMTIIEVNNYDVMPFDAGHLLVVNEWMPLESWPLKLIGSPSKSNNPGSKNIYVCSSDAGSSSTTSAGSSSSSSAAATGSQAHMAGAASVSGEIKLSSSGSQPIKFGRKLEDDKSSSSSSSSSSGGGGGGGDASKRRRMEDGSSRSGEHEEKKTVAAHSSSSASSSSSGAAPKMSSKSTVDPTTGATIHYTMLNELIEGETMTKHVLVKCVHTDMKQYGADKNKTMIKFTFEDESQVKIGGTIWDDYHLDFKGVFVVGQLYHVTGFTLKPVTETARKFFRFPCLYEMDFGRATRARPVEGDFSVEFNFTKISDIHRCRDGELIDVVGTIVHRSEERKITTKNGPSFVRTLIIMDETNHSIEVTAWGRDHAFLNAPAGEEYHTDFGVLVMKSCKVSYYNDKAGLSFGNKVYINPTYSKEPTSKLSWIPRLKEQVAALKDWMRTNWGERATWLAKSTRVEELDNNGGITTLEGVKDSTLRTVEQVGKLNLRGDVAQYSVVTATIQGIDSKSNSSWCAAVCPAPECRRRLNESNYCNNCKQSYPPDAVDLSYNLKMVIQDHTGSCIVFAYSHVALKIMDGIRAQELNTLEESKIMSIFQKLTGRWIQMLIKSQDDGATLGAGGAGASMAMVAGGKSEPKSKVKHTIVRCILNVAAPASASSAGFSGASSSSRAAKSSGSTLARTLSHLE